MNIYKILPFAVLLLIVGCTKRPKEVISPEKIVPIIEDIHLTDALLTNSRTRKTPEEIAKYYTYIFKKHHISAEDFKESMKYYAQNPKELRESYTQILENLATRDSILKIEQKTRIDTIQLWEGKTNYKWEKYTTETLPVCIPVEYQKTYTISAEIKIYKDSQVKKITPYFIFDALDTAYVLKTKAFKADTMFQTFKISKMVTDSTVFDLSGNFFPANKEDGEQFKHYEIKNIKITTTQRHSEKEVKDIITLKEEKSF